MFYFLAYVVIWVCSPCGNSLRFTCFSECVLILEGTKGGREGREERGRGRGGEGTNELATVNMCGSGVGGEF